MGPISVGAGVNVNAWVAEDGGFGYSWWWAHGQLHADAAGRYSISGLPSGVHVWLQAFQDGYDQQCAVSVPTLQGDTTVDIALVSRAVVAPTALSPSGLRSVSGSVVVATSAGQQLAAGAFVDFEPIICAWRPDGKQIAIGGTAGEVALWELANGRMQRVAAHLHQFALVTVRRVVRPRPPSRGQQLVRRGLHRDEIAQMLAFAVPGMINRGVQLEGEEIHPARDVNFEAPVLANGHPQPPAR